jgi:glycosyltransferase involved in cell wall biosynthesis
LRLGAGHVAERIAVGFVVSGVGSRWLGQLSYLRNLLTAIRGSAPELEPVAVTSTGESVSAELVFAQQVQISSIRPRSLPWFARMATRELIGRDLLLANALRRNRIRVLSHGPALGRVGVASLAWIPDFQHLHLPHLFSPAERTTRDRAFRRMCADATRIILSSHVAEQHLVEFCPEAAGKARVLQFADCTAASSSPPDDLSLRERYRIPSAKYFVLPNQFWVHKNHRVVIRALAELRARGVDAIVVATGRTEDSREPLHYRGLMEEAERLSVADRFLVLGMIPFSDLAGLIRHSVALLNPSLFEGWSTSVEEAKAFGKATILSDIPVHREQAPDRCSYFDPNDPVALAVAMQSAWENHDEGRESRLYAEALAYAPRARERFASAYLSIVREAIEGS